MEIHMEYHDSNEQDTDWSNKDDTQFEEGQVADKEATGNSKKAWHQVQRIDSRYKYPMCRITKYTKNQIDRYMREHEEDIDECLDSINKCD